MSDLIFKQNELIKKIKKEIKTIPLTKVLIANSKEVLSVVAIQNGNGWLSQKDFAKELGVPYRSLVNAFVKLRNANNLNEDTKSSNEVTLKPEETKPEILEGEKILVSEIEVDGQDIQIGDSLQMTHKNKKGIFVIAEFLADKKAKGEFFLVSNGGQKGLKVGDAIADLTTNKIIEINI